MDSPTNRPALVDIQIATKADTIPDQQQFSKWVAVCLPPEKSDAEVCIRITSEEEIHQLNLEYRQQDKATNVLSFPCEFPPELNILHIGDLVICANIVAQEAHQQSKDVEAHWAHMVIHGILHLLGYDHINDDDAEVMETLECKLLLTLGYSSPYEQQESTQ